MVTTTLPTREVTILLSDATGELRAKSVVYFRLSDGDVDQATGRVIDQNTIRVPLTEDGATVALWPNARGTAGTCYTVSAVTDGRVESLRPISVDDIDGQTLGALQAVGITTVPAIWHIRSAEQEETLLAEIAAAEGAAAASSAVAQAQAATATDAATAAQAARDEAQANARVLATWTALAALTGSQTGESAEVLVADTGTHTDPVVGGTVANAGRYTWSASPAGWKRIGDAQAGILSAEVAARTGVIDTAETPGVTHAFVDALGYVLWMITTAGALRTTTPRADLAGLVVDSGIDDDFAGFAITDARDNVLAAWWDGGSYIDGGQGSGSALPSLIYAAGLRSQSGRTNLGGLTVVEDDYPGTTITDERDYVLAAWGADGVYLLIPDPPPEPEPEIPDPPLIYAAPVLAGAEGETVTLHAAGLLPDRALIGTVRLHAIGASGAVASGDALALRPDQLGDTIDLIATNAAWDGGARSVLSMGVAVAPVPAVSPTTKRILMIGDSITNRQGAWLLDQYLTAWGYLPDWVGTLHGSTSPTNSMSNTGPMGEGREGWETGDFTYAITNRALIVAPGGEATYLALTKAGQMDYNPFLRAATGGDDADDIRNGYVVDVADYLSRFDLDDPDIVVIGLGTNDVRDQEASAIRETVEANIALLIRRIRADLPDATIIVWCPGTARDVTRDALWRDEYIPMLGGLMDAVAGAEDAAVVLAPIWAMAPPDGGYSLTTSATDATTGTITATPDDAIHPVGGARAATFRALAGYIAAAMADTL